MERKVFVVNYSGYDLSAAEQFGKLINLTEGPRVNIFATNDRITEIKHKLIQANAQDYLLLSGSPVLNIIAFSILLQKFGMVNLLIFNSKSRLYTARTITETQFNLKENYEQVSR